VFLLNVAFAALAIAVYPHVPAIGPVSGTALGYSVAGGVGGSTLFDDPCRSVGPKQSACELFDPSSSGSEMFRVTTTERSCWSATRLSSRDTEWFKPPRRADGCVMLSDQLRLFDRLL